MSRTIYQIKVKGKTYFVEKSVQRNVYYDIVAHEYGTIWPPINVIASFSVKPK